MTHDGDNIKTKLETPAQWFGDYFVRATLESDEGDYLLSMAISKKNNMPPIKYADVALKVTDAAGRKLSLKQANAKEDFFMEANSASTTATGNYIAHSPQKTRPMNIEISFQGQSIILPLAPKK